MSVEVDVQVAAAGDDLPAPEALRAWARAALAGRRQQAELAIRLVERAEGAELNRRYRGRDGPTNVLSFPFENVPGVTLPLLGDIVICAPVVVAEAREQHKPAQAHWAHMVVHGVLHLLGYDHVQQSQALEMERLEAEILRDLGYADPYSEAETL